MSVIIYMNECKSCIVFPFPLFSFHIKKNVLICALPLIVIWKAEKK